MHAAAVEQGAGVIFANGDLRVGLRDGRAEAKLLDFFSDAGFVVREGRIVLRRPRDILTFCTQGVLELGKIAELYVSDAFTRIKPRRFSGRASFRMRGGRLVFALLEFGALSLAMSLRLRHSCGILWISVATLGLLPLLVFGPNNDLMLRASAPSLVMLLILILTIFQPANTPPAQGTKP